ncbi:GAF domain-containing protein [Nocardia sp. NPDC051570]|uniref:GAF domain-containing protein n=1 Tax=Nocardia sp. NPDC051570 TaxID=3364324 RepID=UPI00379EB579
MTVPSTPFPASPNSMPHHVDSKLPVPIRRASRHWVIVETLRGTESASVIADGGYRRNFANLNRVTIATSAAIARRLRPLVVRSAISRSTQFDEIALSSGAALRILAVPVFGPAGTVFGVSLWAGPPDANDLQRPTVGVIEWDRVTGRAAVSTTLGRQLELTSTEDLYFTPLPRLMSCFDRWDDRAGFLSLFDHDNPTKNWIGTATTQSRSGARQLLRIAAKVSPTQSSVRAIVWNLPDADSAPAPDYLSAALRSLPLAPDHAIGIMDLKSSLIHEWVDPSRNLSSQRHQPPWIHPADRATTTTTCRQLLAGHSRITSRFRITRDHDEWITVRAHWTLICPGTRPQALIDIAPRHGRRR